MYKVDIKVEVRLTEKVKGDLGVRRGRKRRVEDTKAQLPEMVRESITTYALPLFLRL